MNNKLLSLNVIVGPGDGIELKRLLDSIPKGLIDEYVLISTTNDETVNDVCKQYATKYACVPWASETYPYGNFAQARNAAKDASTCDWILWLDSDDIFDITEQAVSAIRSQLETAVADIYCVEYDLGNNESILRERFFRNIDSLFWQRACHEQLSISNMEHKIGLMNGIAVKHCPLTPHQQSSSRNIAILTHDIESGRGDLYTSWFLAKEYIGTGDSSLLEKGITILREIVDNESGQRDMLAEAAITVARHSYTVGDKKLAETYCRVALSFSSDNAEVLCMLGAIEKENQNIVAAVNNFMSAMNSKFSGVGFDRKQYHTKIPAKNLMEIYYDKRAFSKYLVYSDAYLLRCGMLTDEEIRSAVAERKKVLAILVEELG